MSFKRLDPEDITISAESVVAPLWSTGGNTLTSFYTSSTQVAGTSGEYYYQVYEGDPVTSTSASVQFSIAFADKKGSGSLLYDASVSGSSPSSTIYGQYRNLVLGDEESDFLFGTVSSSYFYAIAVDRAQYKEKLYPGSFNLTLSGSGDTVLKLTDNSNEISTISYVDSGRVYEVISGSSGHAYTGSNAYGYTSHSGSYGKFLPDVGIILLNGLALDSASLGLGTGLSSNTDDTNPAKLYDAITRGLSFQLQSEETITSNYIFTRVRNAEFNYSGNPSITSGSGELRFDIMVNSPQVYLTTIGLYNDNNDLLAVAKLSRPLLKDFTKEVLLRIKLDY